jgi:hypothetical protein
VKYVFCEESSSTFWTDLVYYLVTKIITSHTAHAFYYLHPRQTTPLTNFTSVRALPKFSIRVQRNYCITRTVLAVLRVGGVQHICTTHRKLEMYSSPTPLECFWAHSAAYPIKDVIRMRKHDDVIVRNAWIFTVFILCLVHAPKVPREQAAAHRTDTLTSDNHVNISFVLWDTKITTYCSVQPWGQFVKHSTSSILRSVMQTRAVTDRRTRWQAADGMSRVRLVLAGALRFSNDNSGPSRQRIQSGLGETLFPQV